MSSPKLMSVILVLALVASWTKAMIIYPRLPRECPSFSYDAFYDLQYNSTTTHPSVTEFSPITGTGCSKQGVLKIALASAATDPNRRRVLIDLFFTDPKRWVFNLGDSQTNDGYGGDYSTNRWDAEVQGVVTTATAFSGYLSDNGGSGPAFHILGLYTTRMTLVAGDGYLSWLPDNNNLLNYYQNPNFFALNGQPEPDGPVNYDLYLGLNRVINFVSDRTGTGLCKVGIKFLKEF